MPVTPTATEPAVLPAWANAGAIATPSNGEINAGLGPEAVVGHGRFNWWMNFAMNGIRWLKKVGISRWHVEETYAVGDVVRDSDNNVYQLQTLTGLNPAFSPSAQQPMWARFGTRLVPAIGDYSNELFAYRDAQNRRRLAVDHYGLPAGQIRQWQEVWDRDTTQLFASGAKWAFANLGGGLCTNRGTSGDSLDGDTFRTLRIQPPATLDTMNVLEAFPCIRSSTGTTVTIEFLVATDTVGIGNNHTIQFGVLDVWSGTTRGVVVTKPSANANWLIFSPETGSLDTGIPPVANTYQRVRFEILGAN